MTTELNWRVLCYLILPVWFLAILVCAVVSGVLLLAFVGVTCALCQWLWSVSRPRVQAVGEWQSYNGLVFRMEVA